MNRFYINIISTLVMYGIMLHDGLYALEIPSIRVTPENLSEYPVLEDISGTRVGDLPLTVYISFPGEGVGEEVMDKFSYALFDEGGFVAFGGPTIYRRVSVSDYSALGFRINQRLIERSYIAYYDREEQDYSLVFYLSDWIDREEVDDYGNDN